MKIRPSDDYARLRRAVKTTAQPPELCCKFSLNTTTDTTDTQHTWRAATDAGDICLYPTPISLSIFASILSGLPSPPPPPNGEYVFVRMR